MHADWWKTPATEMRRAIARRELSPVELVRATIDRAERLQPELNCFITLCPEHALEEARRAETMAMRGQPLGLLHGLPFTCKDIVDTRGVRTTFGSKLHADNLPTEDAVAVARLREAGAILIGKTTTSEFGAKCLTDAPLFGRTPNAWHRGRTSGGSSGGAAVATAAGIAPLAVATDGGGSTRIPAACNGVVGLKQSLGVVPHSQVQDAFGNLTYVTPMTRTVADTALMLQAMAGPHDCDPWSTGVQADDYLDGLVDLAPGTPRTPSAMAATAAGAAMHAARTQGLRIGTLLAPSGQPVAAEVAKVFRAFCLLLESLGTRQEEISDEGLDIEPIWRTINHTVWRSRFGPLAREHGEQLTPSLLQQLALAQDVSGADYQQAMFARTRLFRRVQALLAQHDFLVMPTLMRTALPIDQDLFGKIEIDGCEYAEVRRHWFPWTMPFNLTGHPAISLPCGFDADDLPIGVQIVGRFRGDRALLRFAARLETALGLTACWPDLE
jgi:aspartyl-tRNA(Asn)/glutamyl-tRNA(Gln) amidotransferase subunit A